MVRHATKLREIDGVLMPKPLETTEDLTAWYRGESALVELRGLDVAKRLRTALDREATDPPYKAFVLGRPGVGKSTEMTRLSAMVANQYQSLRFSLRDQLDPRNFTPFDVILLTCILLAEETHKVTGNPPESRILKELLNWYADGDESVTSETKSILEASAGVDTKGQWWNMVASAFVTLKGGLQYAETRKREVVAYQLKRIQPLIDIANRLTRNCNANLREYNGKEWLILCEDADKPGVNSDRIKELFIIHGNSIFGGLDANLVFNLPIGLTYGSAAHQLPELPRYTIYDVPVYKPNKVPNEPAIDYVQSILDARIHPALFEEGQARRLIVASGANLRELFAMVRQAAIEARARGGEQIGVNDVETVLKTFRFEYQKRLGATVFDATPVPPEQRIERLVDLYSMTDTGASVLDDILGVLVNSGVVQEFNDTHWFGIHPLVVDVLARMGRIKNLPGGAP